jgi:hypothetical protein
VGRVGRSTAHRARRAAVRGDNAALTPTARGQASVSGEGSRRRAGRTDRARTCSPVGTRPRRRDDRLIPATSASPTTLQLRSRCSGG